MNIAFIGIGSNMGDREKNCLDALRLLEETGVGKILKRSSLYHTPPFGFEQQDWFLNAALKMETSLAPLDFFEALKSMEKTMGRQAGFRWGPRLIDLDLLFYNDFVIESPSLVVPHPGIPKRRFVLEPLAEIEGEWIHPLLKKSVSDLLSGLDKSSDMEALAA
jgi:2-amino-4-hydroxy-6-hydroxymethyldihydropteridine diphosphokinase